MSRGYRGKAAKTMTEPKIVMSFTVPTDLWDKLHGMAPQYGSMSELIRQLIAQALQQREKNEGPSQLSA